MWNDALHLLCRTGLGGASLISFTGVENMQLGNAVLRTAPNPFSRRLSSRLSSSKLFVGGLSYDTNEPVLKDAFEKHGEIIEVKVICDHKTGKSKGYGFVNFTSEDSASKALEQMDGQVLDGRNIRLQYANKR